MSNSAGYWTPEKGVRDWKEGEIFRPGKTRRELATGVKVNYLKNREARRENNKRRAGQK